MTFIKITLLFSRCSDGKWIFDKTNAEKMSHSLGELYKQVQFWKKALVEEKIQIIKDKFDAHYAQDDSDALMQVKIKIIIFK